MEPAYRIYYGKYLDAITNEIPTSHIVSVDGIQFKIEPGKPAEPKIDDVRFTLSNLAHDGAERYGRSWFEANVLTEAEGAIVPDQMYFKVDITQTGKHFTGILRKKKYGRFRETIDITIEDVRVLISQSEYHFFKPFTFEDITLILKADSSASNNDLPDGVDLDGDPISQEKLFFGVVLSGFGADEDTEFEDEYTLHADLRGHATTHDPNPSSNPEEQRVFERYRNAFVKIGDNTILTRIFEYIIQLDYYDEFDGSYLASKLQLYINPFHAINGNPPTVQGNKILERGRFFADDQGNHLAEDERYTVTIYDYDHGFSDDILISKEDGPFDYDTDDVTFMHGCNVIFSGGDPPTQYDVLTSFESHFDTLSLMTAAINGKLLSRFYQDAEAADIMDTSKAPDDKREAFWADLILYGWSEDKINDIFVNTATQTNCYIYYDEEGKIVFHDRLHHEQYLPGSLPPDAFQVEVGDINPLGSYEENNGFDSYTIEYADRIEINNVESDNTREAIVDEQGTRQKASVRNTGLEIKNYRSSDLGVPNMDSPYELPKFRYSPDDPDFYGNGIGLDLSAFLPTAVEQAQNFAKAWKYPELLWKIKWDMNKYPDAGIGRYFWVAWPDENSVYMIRQITHDPDKMEHRMEVQKVGVYQQ